MAIADTILSMATNIENAYDKIEDKGGTIPQNKNLENLADAIDTITGGTPTPPEPTPTSMSYFEANGTELTKYTGSLSEVVVPKSYSKTETIIATVTGAEVNPERSTTGSVYSPSGYITLTFSDGTTTMSTNIGQGYIEYMSDLENFFSQNFVITPVLQSMTQSGSGWLGAPIQIFLSLCDSPNNFLKFPFSVIDTYNYQSLTFHDIYELQGYINNYSSSAQSNIAFSFTDTITLKTVTFQDGNDYQITSIANELFKGNTSLTKVTVLSNIITIGVRVFSGCSNLAEIMMYDGCTTLTNDSNDQEGLFYNCKKLTKVTLSDYITALPKYCFYNCVKLVEVKMPSALTTLNYGIFMACSSLSSLHIPKNVTSIGNSIIQNCPSVVSLTVDSENTTYDSRNNCNCIINKSTNTLLFGSGVATIPNTVTSIANSAFMGRNNLQEITIPSSVTSIGQYAFSICRSLSTLSIPASVTTIGNYAFRGCSTLSSVTINTSTTLTALGTSLFENCTSLKSFTIPNSVTSIGSQTFQNCTSLMSITIPSAVTTIGANAYNGCVNLVTVNIPATVTSIGNNAFKGCTKLQTANIYPTTSSTKITSYSNAWFNGCSSSLVLYIPTSVSDPSSAYGSRWNYYSSSGTLTYYATL